MPTAPTTPSPSLSIEAIVAVDVPREFRLHPRDRVVAYTAEAAGARQLFTVSLRGGYPTQLTASDKPVSDPQWSPDGRRLAYVRDEEIWVVEVDGSRLTRVVARPGRGREPRWSPDGHRIAFLSRRRGWTQVWLIDAPVPAPRSAGERAAAAATDRPDRSRDRRRRLRLGARRRPDRDHEPAAGGPRDLPDLAGRRRDRRVEGRRRRAQPRRRCRVDGRWLAAVRVGCRRLVPGRPADRRRARSDRPDGRGARARRARRRRRSRSAAVAGRQPVRPHRGPRRPPGPARRRAGRGAAAQAGQRSPAQAAPHGQRDGGRQPDQSVGRRLAGRRLARGRGLDRGGRRARCRRRRTCGCCPFPASRPMASRPRQVTDSMPAVLRAALAPGRAGVAERIKRHGARRARASRARCGGRASATGKRGARRVPTIVLPHGGPTGQSFRAFYPFKQLLVAEGFAILDVDFRGSTGYGRTFRHANHGEWGHADVHDLIDAGRWAAGQPWSDGRLAIYGGSYGGYMVLSRARRRAHDVAGRGRPVRRLRDRRELPARRSDRTPRPAPDDGLARRSGACRDLPPRIAGLSRRAHRGAAPDPPRPEGQAGRAADDREDGRGARDRGQGLRGPLVRRGGRTAGSAARTGATPSNGRSRSSRPHVLDEPAD